MTLLATKNAPSASAPLTIRRATPLDAGDVIHLAALDSSRVPTGDVLVARVGTETWAAVSLEDFHAVADPFRPSGDLVVMLIERARSLRRQSEAGASATTGIGRLVFR
jgi:hypothetical protein